MVDKVSNNEQLGTAGEERERHNSDAVASFETTHLYQVTMNSCQSGGSGGIPLNCSSQYSNTLYGLDNK